jgi:hypothetical protein
MEPLRRILSRATVQRPDAAEHQAAAIIDAANRAISTVLSFSPSDARAVSYRRNQIVIQVKHGAIAGQLQIHHHHLIQEIEKNLKQLFPKTPKIDRLVSRLT